MPHMEAEAIYIIDSGQADGSEIINYYCTLVMQLFTVTHMC